MKVANIQHEDQQHDLRKFALYACTQHIYVISYIMPMLYSANGMANHSKHTAFSAIH